MLTLVTGGARSGKSRFAQSLCGSCQVGFIATAEILDEEMQDRVLRHQAERSRDWVTVEEPIHMASVAARLTDQVDVVLLDCLTLWTSNMLTSMLDAPAETIETAIFSEVDALIRHSRDLDMVLVTNEVGSGIVPDTPLGRRFCDLHGWVNQRVAASADTVYWMVCGLPVRIKPSWERDDKS